MSRIGLDARGLHSLAKIGGRRALAPPARTTARRFHARARWFLAAVCGATLLPAASHAKPTTVIAIGDSITLGTSSEPAGPGWVDILASQLGDEFKFINVGRGLSSSLDWSGLNGSPSLFESLAAPRLPVDGALIMLGSIDATGVGEIAPVSKAHYRRAIQVLVDKTLASGVGWVVLTGPPPAWHSRPGEGLLFEYQGVVAEICAATAKVRCGPDLYGQLSRRPPDFASFDLHPTELGHQKIAAAFLPVLRALREPGAELPIGAGLCILALLRRSRA